MTNDQWQMTNFRWASPSLFVIGLFDLWAGLQALELHCRSGSFRLLCVLDGPARGTRALPGKFVKSVARLSDVNSLPRRFSVLK